MIHVIFVSLVFKCVDLCREIISLLTIGKLSVKFFIEWIDISVLDPEKVTVEFQMNRVVSTGEAYAITVFFIRWTNYYYQFYLSKIFWFVKIMIFLLNWSYFFNYVQKIILVIKKWKYISLNQISEGTHK